MAKDYPLEAQTSRVWKLHRVQSLPGLFKSWADSV